MCTHNFSEEMRKYSKRAQYANRHAPTQHVARRSHWVNIRCHSKLIIPLRKELSIEFYQNGCFICGALWTGFEKKNRVSYAIISMHVLVSSVVLALRDDAFIVCACVRCKRMLMHSRAGCHQPSSNNCKPRVTSSPNNVMPIFVVYSVHWYSATK